MESLKVIRTKMGMTQEELAKVLNITTTTYNLKEKGKRPLLAKELYKISQLSGSSMDDIEILK